MSGYWKYVEDNRDMIKRVGEILFLILVGFAINLTGSYVVDRFNLNLYLDTIGTMIVAAMAGYLPGIFTGFITNMTKVIFDKKEIYYCSINMLIAVIIAYSANKGYFKSKLKTMLVAVVIILVAGLFSADITWFLKYSGFFDISDLPIQIIKSKSNLFFDRYVSTLGKEVMDKSISVLIAFIVCALLPQWKKEKLKALALWQTKVDPILWDTIKKKKLRKRSIRIKVIRIFMIGGILIAVSATIISLILFKETATNEHINTANVVINLVKLEIDADMVDEYIKNGFNAPGYEKMVEKLYNIKDSYPDIEFLYSYRIVEDGCVVVFDLNTETVEASLPGEILEFDESFYQYKDELLKGEHIPPIIANDSFGYLLTIYKQLYDSKGNCVWYIGVDFSMNRINEYANLFLIREIIILIGFFILTIAVGLAFVEYNIIIPVNTMAYFVRTFAYDTEEEREMNIERLRNIKITTGDEIENLYHSILKTTEDSMKYSENLRKARLLVENMKEKAHIMDEIAYKDALTGVKNKAAYYEYTNILDKYIVGVNVKNPISEDSDIYKVVEKEFLEDRAKRFALIMIDLNFLKRVNDNYGHMCGDIYLVSCANLLRDIFDYNNVFRIGGDEFVVLIPADKIGKCEELIKQFNKECEKMVIDPNLNIWEQVSAAIGVAYYDEERDKNCEDVFKRADLLMYKNKVKMKGQRR